jgi:hypothetical protein
MSTGTGEEISRFDAENATSQTMDFLKRLGYKQSWQPMKVSMDGDLYIVEMAAQKKLSAKVQINSKTKEIKEYELTESEAQGNSFLNSKKLLFIVVGASAAVVLLQFLGLF